MSEERILGFTEAELLERYRHEDIMGRHEMKDSLYLRRFFLEEFEDHKLYLHKMARSDEDEAPHTHPWPFRTLVLRGGYNDEQWAWTGTERVFLGLEPMLPGTMRERQAEHLHRVRLIDETVPTWTLVWVTKKVRDWDFCAKDGPVFWREYLNDWSDRAID